ncbi:MAG TPA: hypothetical protein PLF81_11765 [Candidatus Anammoximicrobium sp.]|nr:hypothetical protein [Candidatus Anammoximicrobium sp.]
MASGFQTPISITSWNIAYYPCESQAGLAPKISEKTPKSLTGLSVGDFSVEPSPGQGPKAVGLSAAEPYDLAGFLVPQSCEETKFHELGGFRIVSSEFVESLVDGLDFFGPVIIGDGQGVVEVHLHTPAAMLAQTVSASALDQNPPHGLGRRRKEMAAGGRFLMEARREHALGIELVCGWTALRGRFGLAGQFPAVHAGQDRHQ